MLNHFLLLVLRSCRMAGGVLAIFLLAMIVNRWRRSHMALLSRLWEGIIRLGRAASRLSRRALPFLKPVLALCLLLYSCAITPSSLNDVSVLGAKEFSSGVWAGRLPTRDVYSPPFADVFPLIDTPLFDQPEGTSALMAPFVSFMGPFGAWLFRALSGFLAVSLFFLFLARFSEGRALFLALAAFLSVTLVSNYAFGTFSAFHSAAALAFLALFLFLSELSFAGGSAEGPGHPAVLLGACSSALVGIRHEFVLFVIPVFAGISLSRGGWRRALPFLVPFLLLSLPWAGWHLINFGSVFVHESQLVLSQDAMYRQCLGPFCFQFNGFLNFQGGIVRTPGFSYPVFIYLPLLFAISLGFALSASFLVGFAHSLLSRRPLPVALAVSLILFLGLILPMENWGTWKNSIALGALPFLIFFAFLGARLILEGPGRRGAVFFFLGLALVLAFLAWLPSASFPEDARWYERFPTPGGSQGPLRGGTLSAGNVSFLPRLSRLYGGGAPLFFSFGALCHEEYAMNLPPRDAILMVDSNTPINYLLCREDFGGAYRVFLPPPWYSRTPCEKPDELPVYYLIERTLPPSIQPFSFAYLRDVDRDVWGAGTAARLYRVYWNGSCQRPA